MEAKTHAKFMVGYQPYAPDLMEVISLYANRISEVYFSWPGTPNGRGNLTERQGMVDWDGVRVLEHDLLNIKKAGIKLDLLLNGNCYGGGALSKALANRIHSILSYLAQKGCAADVVTTTSPAVAHMVKTISPNTEVRASVNMRIGTVEGMEYTAHLFDSYYVQRDYNRDLLRIAMLKEWADQNGKRLFMLANSGCMRFCSGQTFHDNLVAHTSEIEASDNINFQPHMCWHYLKDRAHWPAVLQSTWIRPEDIRHYLPYCDAFKLATRMHERPAMVVEAYVRGQFFGNLMDLFEPGFGPALAPYVVDSSKMPKDWFLKTTQCDKNCHTCGYCKAALDQALVLCE